MTPIFTDIFLWFPASKDEVVLPSLYDVLSMAVEPEPCSLETEASGGPICWTTIHDARKLSESLPIACQLLLRLSNFGCRHCFPHDLQIAEQGHNPYKCG